VSATRSILTVAAAGALATIQDLGRPGWRRFGVPRSGALDPAALRIANALAGNPAGDPAIEFFLAGPALKAGEHGVHLGLAGDFRSVLTRTNGEKQAIDGWRSVTLGPGETLRAGAPASSRVGVIAVRGLAAAQTLGSASSYLRARLGANEGRALREGDRLEADAASTPEPGTHAAERWLRTPPARATGPIRVVPGPQADHFDAAAMAAFEAGPWTVSAEADRMGIRLQGQALVHRADKGAEIASDATVPGSIQVPGNGQPIVLLADGQTAGGYPKIGTVISADLARLATAPVGSSLQFALISVAEAEAAARTAEAALQATLASIRWVAFDGDIDLDAIYSANLVSGMIDAMNRS
jgi:5-oxoprolinase (ATP-hydrolysing) subunit C